MSNDNVQRPALRKNAQPGNGLTFKSIVAFAVAKWYWFVISLAVTMTVAVVYLMKTTPEYTRTVSLLIKDDDKNGNTGTSIDMSELGFVQNKTNLENEMRILKSPALMKQVVTRLDLNDRYTVREGLREAMLYKCTPVLFDSQDTVANDISFQFTLRGDQVKVSDVYFNGNPIGKTYNVKFGDSLHIGKAILSVIKPAWDASEMQGRTISYTHSSVHSTAAGLAGRVSTVLGNDKSSIIDISITCPSIQEADDILMTLIQVYNERWIQDKNQVAVSTSRFINERLGVIESELGNVDSDISSYKSANLIPDVGAAASMYMEQSQQTQAQMLDLNNQLSMARYIRSYLISDAGHRQLIPANGGLQNNNIQSMIGEYNSMLLQRNTVADKSSQTNPLVVQYDQQLAAQRQAIIRSIDNEITTLNTQLSSLHSTQVSTVSKLASNPTQAKNLLSVERQQKVKESLYLFLLQKREENELTQAFTPYNTSIVEEPHGSWAPTFPKKNKILLIAFLAGLGIPLAIFIIRESLDTKIRGKKDLSSLKIPYLGEIPSAEEKPRGLERFRKSKFTSHKIVVQPRNRDAINEAFRVLRTNLEYMGAGKDGSCGVIAVTSANPGSGKTFISINLAKVLAIKGKRVLVVDLDLRKGSLSKLIGKPNGGITDYIIGKVDESGIIVSEVDEMETLSGVGVGTVPPNPAELLSSDKLDAFISEMSKQYDFIILDCPPVEIVTDAQVINRVADMTIFVIRAGLLEKDELPTIQEYYDQTRYRNMAVLLNATDIHSGYGYHRYGYHYGYGKNYGYGYGYSFDKE